MVNHPNRSKRQLREPEFHLRYFPPCDNWPNGGWSLYQITGDEIAQRIKFDDKNINVTRRDSWCGYIGTFEALPDALEAMQDVL
jgi:hypothetical protein